VAKVIGDISLVLFDLDGVMCLLFLRVWVCEARHSGCRRGRGALLASAV